MIYYLELLLNLNIQAGTALSKYTLNYIHYWSDIVPLICLKSFHETLDLVEIIGYLQQLVVKIISCLQQLMKLASLVLLLVCEFPCIWPRASFQT